MSNSTINRQDLTYKLTSLPTVVGHEFKYKNITGFGGSIFRRPIKILGKLYWHYGIFYGFDKHGICWLLENNDSGVECVTYRDFMSTLPYSSCELWYHETESTKINTVLKRAIEKATAYYDSRYHNCEHFVNYCAFGKSQSKQAENTEKLVSIFITFQESFLFLIPDNQKNQYNVMLQAFDNIRDSLKLPREQEVQELFDNRNKKLGF